MFEREVCRPGRMRNFRTQAIGNILVRGPGLAAQPGAGLGIACRVSPCTSEQPSKTFGLTPVTSCMEVELQSQMPPPLVI